MFVRFSIFALLLVSVLPLNLFGQQKKSHINPGIHDFKFVDEEAYPINLDAVKREIGYPVEALKEKIQGKVMCRILVDETGRYQKHRITHPGHPILSEAVEAHLSNLSFTPARLGGKTTDYWLNVLFEFDLKSHPFKGINKFLTKSSMKAALATNHKKAERYLSQAKSAYTAQKYIQARRLAWSSIHENPLKKNKKDISKEILMEAWTVYAKSEARMDNHEFAARAFTEAIATGEELSKQLPHTQTTLINLYLYRGQARLACHKYEGAMNDLHWVLKQSDNPHSMAKALLLRSQVETHLKAFDQALNDAEKALELNPYYFQAAWQKAELLSFIGAKEEACNILHAYPPVYEEEKSRWKEIVQKSCLTDAAKN